MKTEKLFYETPDALIVALRPRRRILTGSIDAESNALPSYAEDFDEWE